MLKREDCKPGVEIMSLSNSSSQPVWYPNGPREIYTIKDFTKYKFSEGILDSIFLYEIYAISKFNGRNIPFSIKNFKLIDPKQMDQFYRLVEKPVLKNTLIEV